MRIILVHDFYKHPGGEDAVVQQEMASLQKNGHDVLLVSVHNDSIASFFSKMKTAALTIYNPWKKRLLATELRKFKPDVVHVHNFFPQFSPAIFDACRDAGVPTVFTLHNFRILCPTNFLYHDSQLRERSLNHSCFWTVRRRVFQNSYVGTFVLACMVEFHKRAGTWKNKIDRFIALTEFAREKFIEGGLPPDLIAVKGNSATSHATIDGIDLNRRGALFVGRLSSEKGVTVLLDAWKELDYPLRIAGDGPLRSLCESARGGHITYLGQLSSEQIHAEMSRAAFLVIPSTWYEMFPVAMIEAFATGLPVIASNLGGLTEIIKAGRAGLVFDAGSSHDLVDKVNWAAAHPDKMLEMGCNARTEFEHKYSPEMNYINLMKIYGSALECRQQQP